MRREGRFAGKPSNHSRITGKCRTVSCEQCHDSLPLKKSRGKGKGRVKRLVSDIPSTHLLSDWRVSKPSRKIARNWDPDTDDEEVEANNGYDGGKEPQGWALSISLLLDTALEHIRRLPTSADTDGEDTDAEVPDIEAFKNEFEVSEFEIGDGGSATVPDGLSTPAHTEDTDGDNTDAEVPDYEAFKNEFEVLQREIEAGGSPESVAESADSWWGVELSDADESDLGDWEDDWYLVGDEIAV
jgi:hypothetical protein